MDPRIEELLHLELDGQATQEELAELRGYLSSSAESKTYREDLAQMQKVLASTPEVEPPAELRQQILAGVAAVQPSWSLDETRDSTASNPPAASRGRSLGQRFLDSLREGLRPREAFAFGLGAAACLVIVLVAGWDRFESIGFPENALPGSMIPLASSESLQPLDRAVVEVDGLRSVGLLARSGDLLHVTLQVKSVGETSIEVVFEPGSLVARGFAQGSDAAPLMASVADGSISIQHSGNATYGITFEERRPRSSEILILIQSPDQKQEIKLRSQGQTQE